MNIDQKIWEPSAGGHRSEEEWAEIAQHLVQTLGEYLNQRVELVRMSVVDDEALCCSIRSVGYFGEPLTAVWENVLRGNITENKPLAVAWEGILGLDVIEDKPYVSASLFLFRHGRRLTVSERFGSYLEFLYEHSANGYGRWRSLGWMEDIYDEYQSIDAYTGSLTLSI
jgi:hypothetical protein